MSSRMFQLFPSLPTYAPMAFSPSKAFTFSFPFPHFLLSPQITMPFLYPQFLNGPLILTLCLNSYPFSTTILPPIRYFFMLLISPHPFIPQILASSSIMHVNLSPLFMTPTHVLQTSWPHPLFRSTVSYWSPHRANSILYFIYLAPIFL